LTHKCHWRAQNLGHCSSICTSKFNMECFRRESGHENCALTIICSHSSKSRIHRELWSTSICTSAFLKMKWK